MKDQKQAPHEPIADHMTPEEQAISADQAKPVEKDNSIDASPEEPKKDNKKRTIIASTTVAVVLIAVGAWFVFAGAENDIVNDDSTEDVVTESVAKDTQTYSFAVVDTNQANCYGADSQITCPKVNGQYYGQDAQYTGNAPSYTDNGDGTVTDNVTELMWQQESTQKMTYSEAVDGADTFTLAGYDDWRAPSIKELYSLMDFNGIDPDPLGSSTSGLRPFIDNNFFDFEYGDTSSGSRIIDSQWVTTNVYESTVMNNQKCFFGVNFADGRIKCYPTVSNINQGYFVRYVRGESYGENDFKDNDDGTISDASTGLLWQKADSGKGINWNDSLGYCEDLTLAGSSDWRLPNAKELHSIVDYSRSPDTTNSPAIDPIFETTSITNESNDKDWPFFWTSTTHIGHMGVEAAAYISFGRAMGNMGGWNDVHGAGAQRSDPKSGNPSQFSDGRGPQGDAVRINNYVRCVR